MGLNPDPLGYGWNARAARYVDLSTGRFVAQADVVAVMERRIEIGIGRLQDMARGVIEGRVDVAALQEAGVVELRRINTQLAALGRGGWGQMSQADWGRVGAHLRQEYEYWRNFMQDIASGNLTEAQISARLSMYGNHAWQSYWMQDETAKREAGAVEERNILDDGAAHCVECPELTARGWVAIGALPPPGARACVANCRCTIERRNALGEIL